MKTKRRTRSLERHLNDFLLIRRSVDLSQTGSNTASITIKTNSNVTENKINNDKRCFKSILISELFLFRPKEIARAFISVVDFRRSHSFHLSRLERVEIPDVEIKKSISFSCRDQKKPLIPGI